MPDIIGQSLGRYHILEQLGEGGMATVYKAFDTRLETEVAVKVIRTENIIPSVLDRALKRFEREAKALARLTHPNIVKVSDYGENEGKPYLVMPYLPGGTLKQKLSKPIPWQEAFQILLPIAEALDYAHCQNMIHRDVKPSNILLTQRGQPMLTDFGIAKILDVEETIELTGTSTAVGTPEYMAPEQITAKTVDHRADIYALGVVLYEMVTGRKPFLADTPMAVLIKHATESLPRPKQFMPNLPDAVERVLLKALAKNPADRYQSMAEMGAAFEKIISDQALDGQAKKSLAREAIEFLKIQKTEAERQAASARNTKSKSIADVGKKNVQNPLKSIIAFVLPISIIVFIVGLAAGLWVSIPELVFLSSNSLSEESNYLSASSVEITNVDFEERRLFLNGMLMELEIQTIPRLKNQPCQVIVYFQHYDEEDLTAVRSFTNIISPYIAKNGAVSVYANFVPANNYSLWNVKLFMPYFAIGVGDLPNGTSSLRYYAEIFDQDFRLIARSPSKLFKYTK